MNCLRMDLRRSIFCKKFVLIVMATLLVLFASTWNEFQSYTWWGDSTGMQGCVNILYNSLAYDKFKVVIVFLFGGIYTGSYCSDENSRYLRSILNRTTLLSYTISRFLVNFIAIILGMIIVIGLYLYQPNLFVAVGMCGLTFYAAASYIPYSSIFSVLGLISMMPTFSAGTATPHTLMFLWGMLYPLTVYAFCAFFFARRLEWRKKHGLI